MKYSVKLDGRQFEVEVQRIADDFRALTKAEVSGEVSVSTQTERQVAAPAAAQPTTPPPAQPVPAAAPAVSAGECQILSPMPGTILDVKVAAGQSVKAGVVVVVIEAMKMENEIVAPRDGVVTSVPVKKGDALETDAVLAVLS